MVSFTKHGIVLGYWDMMIVYGDYPNSKGCMRELVYCMDNYIPFTNEEGFLQLVGQNKSLKEVREALKFW